MGQTPEALLLHVPTWQEWRKHIQMHFRIQAPTECSSIYPPPLTKSSNPTGLSSLNTEDLVQGPSGTHPYAYHLGVLYASFPILKKDRARRIEP